MCYRNNELTLSKDALVPTILKVEMKLQHDLPSQTNIPYILSLYNQLHTSSHCVTIQLECLLMFFSTTQALFVNCCIASQFNVFRNVCNYLYFFKA